MGKLRNKKGITLVALIITIIVLLILAMVSIRLVMNGGIIDRAQKGTAAYTEEEVKEKIKIAYAEYLAAQYQNPITLETALEHSGLTGATVEQTSDGWNITYNGKTYPLSKSGTVGDSVAVIDWNTVIANAQKHPEQSPTIPEIGIDMYGNSVNLDFWSYELIDDGTNKTIKLGKQIGSNSSDWGDGYTGGYTSDGKLEVEIPQYIKKDNQTYTLTNISYAFRNNTDLKIAPNIPSTVTYMSGTFEGCRSLTTVPNIPNSVITLNSTFNGCVALREVPMIPDSITSLNATFSQCSNLTEIPNIPSTVTDISGAFYECSSLTTVPAIPNSVTNMSSSFLRCVSLNGELVINAINVPYYIGCFEGAATNDGSNLVVSGTCPQLDDIIATKSSNSHITKGQ